MMHNHLIAGDHGYLPTYYDEAKYSTASEATQALREYVDNIIDGIEECTLTVHTDCLHEIYTLKDHPLGKSDHFIDKWYVSGVVTETFLDENENVTMAKFQRELASIDYVEIVLCSESDCHDADYESLGHEVYHSDTFWNDPNELIIHL